MLGVAFSTDGSHLLSSGRDKSVKRTDLSTTAPAEQVNEPQEPTLCLARHPKEDEVTCGGAQGTPRVYKASDLKKRTEQNKDPNLTRSLERLPGPVNALAYSPDGATLAAASTGEVRLFATKDGHRTGTCPCPGGPVFAVAFSPDGKQLCTGGYDGQVRIFGVEKGQLVKVFLPVAVEKP